MMRKLLTILLLIFSASTASAVDWLISNPIRTVNDAWGTRVLRTIESQLSQGHPYSDASLITWAHEGTHGVNSRLRQISGQNNAYFLPPDYYVVFSTPQNVSLANVALAVPQSLRGPNYSLYLVQQQRWWNDSPLYVIDEWVAYRNGAMVAIELAESRRLSRSGWSEVSFACEMGVYACVAYWVIKSKAVAYSQLEQLKEFILWLVRDTLLIAQRVKEIGGGLHRREVDVWAYKLWVQSGVVQ